MLLTNEPHPESVLPALSVLAHRVETVRPEAISLAKLPNADVVIVDARSDLAGAPLLHSRACRRHIHRARGRDQRGRLVALNPEWGVDEMLLPGCGPTEIQARLRLLMSRRSDTANRTNTMITLGELVIDEATYTARVRDAPIELTYLEFELLSTSPSILAGCSADRNYWTGSGATTMPAAPAPSTSMCAAFGQS